MNSIAKDKVIATIPENKEIFLSGLAGNEFSKDFEGIREIADMLESMKKTGVKATSTN
jgi:CO dehydrogenase nickel-insertion accessory protein CooC1